MGAVAGHDGQPKGPYQLQSPRRLQGLCLLMLNRRVVAPEQAREDDSVRGAGILALLTETADRYLNEVRAQADEMIADAKTSSDRMLSEARTTSEQLVAEAERRADSAIENARTRVDAAEQEIRAIVAALTHLRSD